MRQEKIKTLQLHYIQENYSAEKKQMMGLPPTPPSPVDLSAETPRPPDETAVGVLFSGRTINPILGICGLIAAFLLLRRDDVLELLQKNGFLIVLLTLGPLFVAAITSRAGKSIGNMTPWEPSKIPFLVGFAAILAVLYKNLVRTYWGAPRVKDVLPLLFMAMLPFVPFFVLKDFGQMMVFSAVYATLYLIAVRRFSQRFVLCWKRPSTRRCFGCRSSAGEDAGKDTFASNACRSGKTGSTFADSAAFSPLARRL